MCEWSADHDGPMPEFFNDIERKARMSHKCDECGGAILPGQVYRYVSGKWDGYLETVKICDGCVQVIEEFAAAHDDERPLFEGLSAALEECVSEETHIDEVTDEEVISEAGKRWQKALEEMRARRAARGEA